ncbi:MAG TPA: SDR family oxidoreductase [Hyphomicrobiaceae bacterium]|jgi:NAD(P)-dependent dehydrogenase (short-subunit alcohol dehydrogenase family)|nr:SDR family oxidoreductase [Hyphomicrobiaceae bacterium]
MDLELDGKAAVVTGGSRGIGLAVGRALAAEGANVALIARSKPALDAAVARLSGRQGTQAKGFVCDTTDDAAVKAMVADVVAAFGRVDILVNCAAKPSGQARPPTLAEITTEEFWDHMNTKVMGYLRTAREVAPYMIKQGAGRIVNVSGLGAKHVGTTIGSIRNVGVAALTKNLADELAPHGIQVVCVHPGLVRTEATPGVIAAQAKAQGVSEAEIEKRMSGRNLLKKIVTAEEIANVVAFLASPKAVAINGDAIPAGGGTPGSIFY